MPIKSGFGIKEKVWIQIVLLNSNWIRLNNKRLYFTLKLFQNRLKCPRKEDQIYKLKILFCVWANKLNNKKVQMMLEDKE